MMKGKCTKAMPLNRQALISQIKESDESDESGIISRSASRVMSQETYLGGRRISWTKCNVGNAGKILMAVAISMAHPVICFLYEPITRPSSCFRITSNEEVRKKSHLKLLHRPLDFTLFGPRLLKSEQSNSRQRFPIELRLTNKGNLAFYHPTMAIFSTTESNTDKETSSNDLTEDKGGASSDDSSEWDAIVDSFQMYRAAYGDLKVPARFVVPSMPPWPQNAWELKLGQKVAAIRSTGKYIQDSPNRRKVLDDMGFVWRLRAPSSGGSESKLDGISFDQVFSALETYKRIYADLNVPNSFIVPDVEPWPEHTRGMPLGKKLSTIRSKVYLKSHPGAEDKLAALGLQMDGKSAVNDVRYQKVYNALAKYKEIFGDLLVPQPFVVPEGDANWPADLWGLRLGARVNAIRSQGTFVNAAPERKDELDALGFIWDYPANEKGNKRGRKKKDAQVPSSDTQPLFQYPTEKLSTPRSSTNLEDLTDSVARQLKSPNGSAGLPDWTSSPDAWREQRRNELLGQYGPSMSNPGKLVRDDFADGTEIALVKSSPDPETMEERSLAIGLESGIFSGVE